MARPREFDPDTALDAAMAVFWKHGYDGTSLTDLTEAMGINRPSMYAAFGNKEALFRKVMARYSAGPAAYVKAALAAPTARQVAEQLLLGAVELGTCPDNPGGCLMVNAGLRCSEANDAIRQALTASRATMHTAILARFDRAKAEGDLPPEADAEALASYLTVVILGIAVQAASGMDRAAMLQAAGLALAGWPMLAATD